VTVAVVLLHIGHAQNEVEVVLTVVGFVLTLLGLGLAAWALWPRRRTRDDRRQPGLAARRRALREEDPSGFEQERTAGSGTR
jgi:hypothetical protein